MTFESGGHLMRGTVQARLVGRVGGDGFDECFGVQEVMRAVARGSRHRCGALDEVRVAHRPLIGLLRAHRAADHQRQALEAEMFGQQAVLGAYIVADPDLREAGASQRARAVARRGGEAVADLIDDDDAVFRRVQGAALADIGLLHDLAGAGVPGRYQNRVALIGVECAVYGHGQFAIRDAGAFLEFEGADIDQLERPMIFLRVVVGHLGSPGHGAATAKAEVAVTASFDWLGVTFRPLRSPDNPRQLFRRSGGGSCRRRRYRK
ncbi:hypothetical protein D3C75_733540 [compost metagenome]